MYGYGKYVYGILENVDTDIIKEIKGIDDLHNLYSLETECFSIIMSDVDLNEYGKGEIDKRLEDMVWVEEKAKKHFNTIRQFLIFGTVIPMKFCTIFSGEDALLQFTEQYKPKIKEAIFYLSDKQEWDVKVFCDKKKFLECNMQEEKDAMQKQIEKTSRGAAYFLAKKMELNLEEKAKDKIVSIKDILWNDIKVNAEQVKLNKNLSRTVTDHNMEMILNGAFLIKKERIDTFLEYIKGKEAILHDYNMEIKVSGPWPFYNFSNMLII